MKKLILIPALLGSALLLEACPQRLTDRVCSTSLRAAQTAQELIPILVRDWGLDPAKAASWAAAIFAGQSSVATFCALVQPAVAPVAVPGQ